MCLSLSSRSSRFRPSVATATSWNRFCGISWGMRSNSRRQAAESRWSFANLHLDSYRPASPIQAAGSIPLISRIFLMSFPECHHPCRHHRALNLVCGSPRHSSPCIMAVFGWRANRRPDHAFTSRFQSKGHRVNQVGQPHNEVVASRRVRRSNAIVFSKGEVPHAR